MDVRSTPTLPLRLIARSASSMSLVPTLCAIPRIRSGRSREPLSRRAMSTSGRSGISSFKGLDKKHQAIAKTVFQVLTESATVADAKCRLCQIKGDPVSLAEVQEPEGLNGQSAKPLSGLRGTEGSNSSSSSGESPANLTSLWGLSRSTKDPVCAEWKLARA